MTTQRADELRALRERAYGPNADIQMDAAALRRLRQLEGRQQPAERTEPVVDDGAAAASDLPAAAPARVGAAAVDPVPPQSARRWPRLRTPALWIASLLIAIVATVAASAAVFGSQPVHVDPAVADATLEAVLGEDPGFVLPAMFGPADASDARGFTEFHGLRAVITAAFFGSDASNDECIAVVSAQDAAASTDDSFSGPMYVGCAANSFAATVAFKVTDDSPEQLRQAFGEGTALQFAYDEAGDHVVVFSSTAAK